MIPGCGAAISQPLTTRALNHSPFFAIKLYIISVIIISNFGLTVQLSCCTGAPGSSSSASHLPLSCEDALLLTAALLLLIDRQVIPIITIHSPSPSPSSSSSYLSSPPPFLVFNYYYVFFFHSAPSESLCLEFSSSPLLFLVLSLCSSAEYVCTDNV